MPSITPDTPSLNPLITNDFDYIVVGGGTAGLAVASRLTEDSTIRVLVIEAGANRVDDPRIKAPGLAIQTLGDPDFDWNFTSSPQANLNGREIAQPRGRTLGGTSAVNFGMIIYPTKASYDAWEKLGNPGWNWDTLQPYLKKFHTMHDPSEETRQKLSLEHLDINEQGRSGPVQVSFGDSYPVYNEAWPKTFGTLGYKLDSDPFSGAAVGGFVNPGSVDSKTGHRSHAGTSYYSPEIAKRGNLVVLTEATVERINLQPGQDGLQSATGVRVRTKDGIQFDVSAKEEVILSAGTLKSPHVLELSGIGSAKHLKSVGIDVVIDNPNVGENLQDHGLVPFSWEIADGQDSGDALRQPEVAQAAVAAFMEHGKGPLSMCGISSSFVPLDVPAADREEIFRQELASDNTPGFPSHERQRTVIRQMLSSAESSSGQYHLVPFQILPRIGSALKDVFQMSEDGKYISVVSVLNHPLSRGTVHAASSDPSAAPLIDPRYLSHPLDQEVHARHVLWMEKLAAAEPMASLLKKDGRRIHGVVEDMETAKRIAKETFVSNWHLTSTCAMMPRETGGVVNENLKVYGTGNLRVVDASVFPMIPSGNIQSSVYAVAERAADLIQVDLKQKRKTIA